MTVHRIISLGCVLLACTPSLLAQVQQTGTTDYVLGNSSVMWLPRSSSLFLNPGELARLHQNEFLVSSGRFETLASMSGSFFVPGTGTFALGAAPGVNSTLFSLGYGHLVGDYNTAGVAVVVLPKEAASVRFSFGGALHLPSDGQHSGVHAGLSVTNLPAKAVVNVGAGYWLLKDQLRIQLATQTRLQRAEFLGAEANVLSGLRVQAGTRGFKKFLGGISYAMSYATLAIGAGPEGVSFTMNVRVGDAASDVHDQIYGQADEAFADGRYGDAEELYLNALQYDEYDRSSRQMAERSQHMIDSSVADLLREAHENEVQRNYVEAMRAYAQILKIDPRQSAASSNLADVQNKLKLYVQRLLMDGDSLKNRHEIARAKHSYELALELDPDNDSVSVRINELENLSKEDVRSMLARARSFLRKNQLDEAEKEFQRVLSADPTNSQARSGLRTVSGRRTDLDVSRGKEAFAAAKYFDALQIFADIIKRDGNNKEAKQWLEKARDALRSDVDKFFKTGLQFYIKEDFKSAIEAWDKVLMIQPSDSSTLEYRKRAEEKLKALEQFK